jgi:positive regulator of sigma E activity
MATMQKYIPFFASALLMCVLLFIIYPHYQYYIDPDGTAYLTISQRYASGDYQTAINGYWSPWSCWLTALLIKQGLAAIPASVIINALGAVCFLFISQSFFLKFSITGKLQWLLNITLAIFLCYAVFWQSFDDLWECFFLLAALRIMLADDFKSNFSRWIAIGILGSLAYFAKAYSFPFFILNTLCCTYFICKGNKLQWLKISAVAIAVMLFGSHFWIVALLHKYGVLTTSTAGSLNMSWYLVGHPQWKEGIDLLIPPAYKDSPYYWEDPYLTNGITPHFWDSWRLLGLQIVRIGLNIWKFICSAAQLSTFFPFIFLLLLQMIRVKKIKFDFFDKTYILTVSFLLFPIGYLLINFESRYLWYLLPLGMLMVGIIIQSADYIRSRNTVMIIFCFTFLIYPVSSMRTMYNEGINEHRVAEQLKRMNIHGSFTCIAQPGVEAQRIERLAYFSGNQFYSLAKQVVAPKDLLAEMRHYHVNYFFVYGGHSTIVGFRDEQGTIFPEITKGSIDGVQVFQVNP